MKRWRRSFAPDSEPSLLRRRIGGGVPARRREKGDDHSFRRERNALNPVAGWRGRGAAGWHRVSARA